MTEAVARKLASPLASIASRPEPGPIFAATGRDSIVIRKGTIVDNGGRVHTFAEDLKLDVTTELKAGKDCVILWGAADAPYVDAWRGDEVLPLLGGFHYAPGGNATARAGGDDVPAINPLSIWDVGFRPACADPRGMAYVAGVRGSEGVVPFWVDLYLLGVDHLAVGTSLFATEIADGDKHRPNGADGKPAAKLDYATAKAIVEGHGKELLSTAEFAAAAYGVTERTSADSKPKLVGLDAPRTSACGMMQATGNLYVWGHDGDPDSPRASLFGGHWAGGEFAGSRCALVDYWPDPSAGWVGARGRSDHLQLD